MYHNASVPVAVLPFTAGDHMGLLLVDPLMFLRVCLYSWWGVIFLVLASFALVSACGALLRSLPRKEAR